MLNTLPKTMKMKFFGVMQTKVACQFTDGEHMQDESSSSLPQLFDGFQTITTLGKDVVIKDHLATPNFSTYITSTMPNETKEKLEKMQRDASNENEATGNPLEHYVFGSETTILKGCRTSLWELFQKTKPTEEKAKPTMKKILKRRAIQPSSKHCTVDPVGTICSGSADHEKLHKSLRMLYRAHPEALAISQKSQNLWNYVMKSNCNANRNQMLSEDIIIFPYRSISEKSENHTKSNISDHRAYGGGDTNCKRESWIKSDAEYLILEL